MKWLYALGDNENSSENSSDNAMGNVAVAARCRQSALADNGTCNVKRLLSGSDHVV